MTYKTASEPLHNITETIHALMLGANCAVSSCGLYHLSLEEDVFHLWIPALGSHPEAHGAFEAQDLRHIYARTRWQVIPH